MHYRQLRSLPAALVALDSGLDVTSAAAPASYDEIPDVVEDGDLILQGGRGVGCHVGVTGQSGPTGVLVLMLALCLGIRRYKRN